MKNIYLTFFSIIFLFSSLNSQILEEDFENGLPVGWTISGEYEIVEASDINGGTFTPPEHGFFLAVDDDELGDNVSGDSRIETSVIDLTNAPEGLALYFETFFVGGEFGGYEEEATVSVSTDGGSNFEEILNIESFGTDWGQARVALPYTGQEIILAFDYTDGGGWNFGLAIDDIVIEEAPKREIAAKWLNEEQYFTGGFPGGIVIPGCVIENNGVEVLESIELTINGGNGDMVTTLTDLNLGFGELMTIEADPIVIGDQNLNLNVRLENINGQGDDENTSNDIAGFITVEVVNPQENRGIVMEEGTSTQCQICPRGKVYMDGLARRYPTHFIGISVHDFGEMRNPSYDNNIGFPGLPNGRIERGGLIIPQDFEAPFISRVQQAPKADIDLGAIYEDGKLTVSVSAEILQNLGADHRLGAILVEDGVTGTSSDYDQRNTYSGGDEGMGGFELLPEIVPAEDMVYNNVGRVLIGGFLGTEGTMTNGAQVGEEHYEIFPTFTLDSEYDYNNLRLVAFVMHAPEMGSKTIKNAWSKTLDQAVQDGPLNVSTTDISLIEDFSLFPSPFQNETRLTINMKEAADVRLIVYDVSGKSIHSQDYGKLGDTNTLTVNTSKFEEGEYYFQVISANQALTKVATKIR